MTAQTSISSIISTGRYNALYFIGIGGIGMSALARYYHSRGVQVSGYDKTRTPLTQELEAAGMAVHYTDEVALAPREVDLVVYTPAIPADHAELNWYRQNGYQVVKRSDVLQMITASSFNVCVGGTHGKTTITTMIAHLLRHSGYGCNAFLGGISTNYHSNFWSSERNVSVIEADEYDRSFLKLTPDVAVITAMDADHLDIYGTLEEVEAAYIRFAQQIKPGGCLVSKYGLKRSADLKAATQYTYSFSDAAADVYARDIEVRNGSYHYTVQGTGWEITNVVLHMGGLHNVENTVAAIAVAKHLQISDDAIRAAIADFKGVKRRFEYYLKTDRQVLIDDYAHHPEELKALLNGVRSLYGDAKCTVVFQPHLYSRTKDLSAGFAQSLDIADEVILLPIYPARELPMEGVTSDLIAQQMHTEVKLLDKAGMLNYLQAQRPGLVVMAGAGDIDVLVPQVKNILENQENE
jgi:UDP-N-acetylmuramate--alanine ligase